jgi:hypothetical protein
VDGGYYLVVEMMLDMVKGVGQVMNVVAVDDGDRPDHFFGAQLNVLFYDQVPYQISYGF